MNPSDIAKAKVIIVDGILTFEKDACLETKLEKCISRKEEAYIAKTVSNFPYTYEQLINFDKTKRIQTNCETNEIKEEKES